MFPPLPSWAGFHPLVIHFPIGLLLIAPLFVLIALVLPKHRMTWSSAALTLMIAGTIAIFIAMASGEAAEEGADLPDGVDQVITQHEHLAGMARNIFLGLTIVYAGFLIYGKKKREPIKHATFASFSLLFLLAYGAGSLVLANAAHAGGRLVHQFGIRSPVPEAATMATNANTDDADEKTHDSVAKLSRN